MCILDLLVAMAVPTGVSGYQMHQKVILMAVMNVLAYTPATPNPRKADAKRVARWWFQIFFIFTPIWGNDPI